MSERNGITKTGWLLLASEGGRWTPKDVQVHLPTMSRQMLGEMCRSGMLQRWESREKAGTYAYGVTATCRIPQGITVAEISAAGIT